MIMKMSVLTIYSCTGINVHFTVHVAQNLADTSVGIRIADNQK